MSGFERPKLDFIRERRNKECDRVSLLLCRIIVTRVTSFQATILVLWCAVTIRTVLLTRIRHFVPLTELT